MTELNEFWEKSVRKGWKHFVNSMSEDKIDFILKLFEDHCLSQLDLSEIKYAVDWGCGGGLLSKKIVDEAGCKVSLVDLSKESLKVAKKYIDNDELVSTFRVKKVLDLKLEPEPDLLFCYSVIQHFPSVSYWKDVSSHWVNELKPSKIAIRTKTEGATKEAENYYKGRGFLRGLVLSEDDLLSQFSDYEVVYKEIGVTKSRQKDIYLVLSKK